MKNEITLEWNACHNCFHEVNEKLKASSITCNDCCKNGTKEKPFLNWKPAEKVN